MDPQKQALLSLLRETRLAFDADRDAPAGMDFETHAVYPHERFGPLDLGLALRTSPVKAPDGATQLRLTLSVHDASSSGRTRLGFGTADAIGAQLDALNGDQTPMTDAIDDVWRNLRQLDTLHP